MAAYAVRRTVFAAMGAGYSIETGVRTYLPPNNTVVIAVIWTETPDFWA
jgi:hypothetical protein